MVFIVVALKIEFKILETNSRILPLSYDFMTYVVYKYLYICKWILYDKGIGNLDNISNKAQSDVVVLAGNSFSQIHYRPGYFMLFRPITKKKRIYVVRSNHKWKNIIPLVIKECVSKSMVSKLILKIEITHSYFIFS